jgi:transcriptional regulator with XRE-family HTH domain
MFAQRLRDLRHATGLTYLKMTITAGCKVSTLAKAARGEVMPTWNLTERYLRGCGLLDPEVIADWKRDWQAARDAASVFPSHPRLDATQMPDPRRIRNYSDLLTELQLLKTAAGNLPYRSFYYDTAKDGRARPIPKSTLSDLFQGRHLTRYDIYTKVVTGLIRRVALLYGHPANFDSAPWSDRAAWFRAWGRADVSRKTRRGENDQSRDHRGGLIWIAGEYPEAAAQFLRRLPLEQRDAVLQDLPLEIATAVLRASAFETGPP